MKIIHLLATLLVAFQFPAMCQVVDIVTVGGDFDKFYPVTFYDGGFAHNNESTQLEITRHMNDGGTHKGPLIATFRYRVNAWGDGAEFIEATINQGYAGVAVPPFIAGWKDVSYANASLSIVIWLRGGTSYNIRSNYAVSPVAYDQPLADGSYYKEGGGPSHSYKTALDPYVNSNGFSGSQGAYFQKGIKSTSVKVTQQGWADFVFEPDYKLPSLLEIEQYIKHNKHLPDVPSANDVARDGQDVGEMNKILLQKVEELTLHLIELNNKLTTQQQLITEQREEISHLKKAVK